LLLALTACVFALVACKERKAPRDREAAADQRGRTMLADTARCEATRDPAACTAACDLNNSNSCARAAELARAAGDEARAAALFRKSCDGGSGLGCAGAGDQEKARFYSRVHCEQEKHADSCLELSHIFRDGRGGPADADAAFTFLQRACKLGSQAACQEL
jgi:TPR repeat protein